MLGGSRAGRTHRSESCGSQPTRIPTRPMAAVAATTVLWPAVVRKYPSHRHIGFGSLDIVTLSEIGV